MEREARQAFDIRAEQNRRRARQANLARAEGKVHTSKGVVFYRDGVGQKQK